MDVAREMVPDIVRSPLAKAGMSLPRLRPRPRLDPQRARIRREMADIAAGAATLQWHGVVSDTPAEREGTTLGPGCAPAGADRRFQVEAGRRRVRLSRNREKM